LLLLALVRQANPPPKKKHCNVKEPDPLSGSSPNELHTFIFHAKSISVLARENSVKISNTKKVFFAIFYLRGVALDYFELFINKPNPHQGFNFLDNWFAFV